MMETLHAKRFPNEPADYRAARFALLEAELALEEKVKSVAELRAGLPDGGAVSEDYVFDTIDEGEVRQVRLSDLFESGKSTLFLYSLMYGPDDTQPCSACTSLVDGFNGVIDHVQDRINMAIVARSPMDRLSALAKARGWNGVRLLSSHGNSYNTDYAAETDEGNQIPAATIFVKRDGEVRHFYSAEQLYVRKPGHPRHVDRLWPIWNIFDLTPEGRGENWHPKLSYNEAG